MAEVGNGKISNRLIFFRKEISFKTSLGLGNIPKDSLVFIEETGQIYTFGRLFSDYETIRKALFENGEGSVESKMALLREQINGGASESYNTLKKIEDWLKEFGKRKVTAGQGIKVSDEGDGETKVSVDVDGRSIIVDEENKLTVQDVNGGTF